MKTFNTSTPKKIKKFRLLLVVSNFSMLNIFRSNTKFICLFLLVSLITIAGCNTLNQKPEYFKAEGCKDIGILLPATGGEAGRWEQYDRHFLEKGIIDKIKGVTIRYFNANSQEGVQEQQANLALKGGSCILIVAAVDGKEGINIVKKAKNQGVPVIAYDRLIEDKDLNCYISFDSKKVGEFQANYVMDKLSKGENGIYKLKPGANFVMINGDKKDPNTTAIEEGWSIRLGSYFDDENDGKLNPIFPKDKNDKNNKIHFIDRWDSTKAEKKVQELLKKHQNNIQIILVANDGMANKIIGSLGDKKGKILITGQDGSPQSARNIVRGYQGITIYKPSKILAEKTVELVVALSNGKITRDIIKNDIKTKDGSKIPSILLTPKPVTKDNISILIEDGIVSKQNLCQGIQGICP
ncbi:sugar ABC transporter substrate-binding protein [Okeania sp. SIO1I7]|uniref:sugar ABC transporter substrate-binding protein n=1 Tax=Okeania sp. SIO1I7 TaxID=2607772 RepID=UPI0013F74291|nr:substrate-binding domain-containing protein [Okeania sp. SIO1I7]NET26134.1 substrate-binding domain-containing protein [Okeania sp. SIO1I7]